MQVLRGHDTDTLSSALAPSSSKAVPLLWRWDLYFGVHSGNKGCGIRTLGPRSLQTTSSSRSLSAEGGKGRVCTQ